MRIFPTKFTGLSCMCLIFSTFFSCSKDTDLLADYVTPGNFDGTLTRFVVDDSFLVYANSSVRLDVLANDTFPDRGNIGIVRTTSPTNGSVNINEDYSLTYVPDGPEITSDTFTYTAQVVEEDNSISQETGTVTVIMDDTKEILDMGELKAFPGAEGFGRYTTGGRGGIIVEVTNLNDSGPGSLRNALEMTVPRTVVFKVGGTIECNSFLSIPANSGNVTIAGQTAPGDGIAIKGAELRIQASNVIVRYIRIRPGSGTSDTNEDGVRVIAYSGQTTENVILDHVSITWGKDENVEIGGIGNDSSVKNVTIQNSIIAENIQTNYGLLLWNRATNISIYNNLFAHNSERNIRSSTCTSQFEMINNVVYGFKAAAQPTYENQFSIIGNVFKANPEVETSGTTIKLEASENNCPDGEIRYTEAYIEDNLLDGNNAILSSELELYLISSPSIFSGIVPIPAKETELKVLGNVGANVPNSDDVDIRLINDTKNKTGSITNIETGGYPILKSATPYVDQDKDGIWDDWEVLKGLDPKNSNDAVGDRNGDGYTNREEFLYFLTL